MFQSGRKIIIPSRLLQPNGEKENVSSVRNPGYLVTTKSVSS
jgi:hypothetical protein